ncbi:MAG: TolC family protein, partial [Kiloniellaceae bacterium]
MVAVLLIALSLPGGTPAAQDDQSKWTLEELLGVALDRNPGLAVSRTGITVAEEDINAARGERLPRVDAVGLGEYFPRRERLLIFRHGFRKDDNPFETAIVNYGLEVTLPLYTSGRIEHGIALAEARAKAARSRVRLTRNELIFNVASAYYTGLRIQQVIAAQEATLTSLNESLRVAELQREVGRIAPLDLLRIKTRVSQAERDLAGARNAYAQVLEVLKELMNVPTQLMLDIVGALVQAPSAVALEQLHTEALSERPEIVALRHDVRAQKEAVGVAAARLGPEAGLFADYRGVTGVDDGITRDDARILLQVRIPIYQGGVLRAQRRKAFAQLRQTELRLEEAERRALAEVERAVLDLQTADPRIEAGRRAVGQGEESLRVEREKFSQGRGTSNDLLLAEEALLRSRTELAAALSDSQIARAALNLAVGQDPVA